jgi:hypothetical protein
MKRFRRWLLNGLAALSLLLLAATIILDLRSYRIADDLRFQNDRPQNGKCSLFLATADSNKGTAEIVIESGTANLIESPTFNLQYSSGPAYFSIFESMRRTKFERFGFRIARDRFPFVHAVSAPNGVTTVVDFPLWFPAIIFTAIPLRRFSLLRERRNLSPHYCHSCGYDLRATPNRCPECGTVPTKTQTAP